MIISGGLLVDSVEESKSSKEVGMEFVDCLAGIPFKTKEAAKKNLVSPSISSPLTRGRNTKKDLLWQEAERNKAFRSHSILTARLPCCLNSLQF